MLGCPSSMVSINVSESRDCKPITLAIPAKVAVAPRAQESPDPHGLVVVIDTEPLASALLPAQVAGPALGMPHLVVLVGGQAVGLQQVPLLGCCPYRCCVGVVPPDPSAWTDWLDRWPNHETTPCLDRTGRSSSWACVTRPAAEPTPAAAPRAGRVRRTRSNAGWVVLGRRA